MNFKKLIFLLITAGLFSIKAKSQQLKIALAPEINFPTGNAASISGIGFGAALKVEIPLADRYALTAAGSYNLFITKKVLGTKLDNINAVPVKLGLKHYPSPDFYIEGQAGTVFDLGTNSKTSFVWSPGFGTYIKTGRVGNKIDFGLRYEAWTGSRNNEIASLKTTGFAFIGLKLGYMFGL